MRSNKPLGYFYLLLIVVVWCYYTVWALFIVSAALLTALQPLVDYGHEIH